MLFQGIILKCSSHIKTERSISSIYYLLTGKRAIQTVQDAHLYELDQFYGIYKTMSKSSFDQVIDELVEQQLLTIPSESTLTTKPTLKGIDWLHKHEHHLPFRYFNGMTYNEIDILFLERFLLLIQVLTNSKMNHTSYIPVIDRPSTTQWIKTFYQKEKLQVDARLKEIYHELSLLLAEFSDAEAEMFVDRLTGFQHYGLSIHQLANRYNLSTNDAQILLIGMTHHMLDHIQRNPPLFPLLLQIIADQQTNGFITQSAKQTYQLIKKGYSIDKIAQMRSLKINTIYDHIVEISLYDKNFPIDLYVSKEQQREILQAARQLNTSKLRNIKEAIGEDISYFQIRLALTSVEKSLMK